MNAGRLFGRLCRFVGLIALLSDTARAGPMQTDVHFGVSPTGAAIYTIPIAVPPGVAGIEPQLALVYNSQGGNGLLGMGWSLSGLSAVTRCPRTKAQDGDGKRGIHFDADDRYCLDGQRLIVIGSNGGGTEYRTERESFSRIVSFGAAGNGPARFKVWTKAGQIIEYGYTADSQVEAQGKSSVRVWAMNKLSDTNGNYLTVAYTEDSANGDYYPIYILYTRNDSASTTPSTLVQFTYDGTTANDTRPDIVSMYFQGSLIRSTKRLTKIADGVREYRLGYEIGASKLSRISSITECAVTANVCKPAVIPTWSEYGGPYGIAGYGNSNVTTHFVADVNGDGKADFISRESDGIYVALSTGGIDDLLVRNKWIDAFGTNQGWYLPGSSTQYRDLPDTPIQFHDVNGDGFTDIVGFSGIGVMVALSDGSTKFSFAVPSDGRWIANFGTLYGWGGMDSAPRVLSDVNGDGRPDIVGFGSDGVYVAFNTGISFGEAPEKWSNDFGTATAPAYANNSANPRFVLDVDGDGLPDIVGFASDGVYVALNSGTGNGSRFAPATPWIANFGVNAGGWGTMDAYPRTLADVNGDGLPDIIGFKGDGVYVAINTGTRFQDVDALPWIADFGTTTSTPYATQNSHPRYLADVNGDGKADIVGFSADGVQMALSTGAAFRPSTRWRTGYGSAAGYGSTSLRMLAEIDGDGFPDIVAVLNGTTVIRSLTSSPADLVTAIGSGLGLSTSVRYGVLTNPSIYTRGTSDYPQMDLIPALSVVSEVQFPNGLGGGKTTNTYTYGGMAADVTGRGMLGFAWQQVLQSDRHISVRTDYRQDWPYVGLVWQTKTRLTDTGHDVLLGQVNNYYGCQNPLQTEASPCGTPTPGLGYFVHATQTVQKAWDINGVALPVLTTTSEYDNHGNAKIVTAETRDGPTGAVTSTKTTTNIYADNTDAWHLGRLVRSQVSSMVDEPTLPANPISSGFDFNTAITTDTPDYDLRGAAKAAGWNEHDPLAATVTIESNVKVYANSTAKAAFSTGSPFPPGSTITIINKGYIVGAGGAGGDTEPSGEGGAGFSGAAGGDAISLGTNVTINNVNGYIFGGGGGGGGSDDCDGSWATGGGGGQGYVGGIGGWYGGEDGSFGSPGSAGMYPDSGNGGAWGAAGGRAYEYCQYGGAGGGAAGRAVVLNNKYITWQGGHDANRVRGAVQ